MFTPEIALALWYRALADEIGVRVISTDKKNLDNLLYEVRQKASDPELEKLSIFRPTKFPDELWIVNKAVELD